MTPCRYLPLLIAVTHCRYLPLLAVTCRYLPLLLAVTPCRYLPSLLALTPQARRAWGRGEQQRAISLLRNSSLFLEHAVYSEPPAWYYDVRDCLGYALLHASPPDPAAALAVHLSSLRRFPRSGWALVGAVQVRNGR